MRGPALYAGRLYPGASPGGEYPRASLATGKSTATPPGAPVNEKRATGLGKLTIIYRITAYLPIGETRQEGIPEYDMGIREWMRTRKAVSKAVENGVGAAIAISRTSHGGPSGRLVPPPARTGADLIRFPSNVG